MNRKLIKGLVAAGAATGFFRYIVEKERGGDESGQDFYGEKNALIVSSVASMIDQFNIPNIKLLLELGYNVDVATNFVKGSTCSDKKIAELYTCLDELHVDCYQIDFDRKVTDVKTVFTAFKQLNDVVKGKAVPTNSLRYHRINQAEGSVYTFIHSHSPIGGVVGRIIAHRNGIKSIYTAHGFHFYDGAPKKNWLVYYPIEKALSWITDVLITINKEDYHRAQSKFHAKKVVYIPGVGVDTGKYQVNPSRHDKNRVGIRNKYGIPQDAFVLISVGELNRNKNHETIIKAMQHITEKDIYYMICGQGEKEADYKKLIRKSGLQNKVLLVGFQSNIVPYYDSSDCFVFPSRREGLGLAALEAMSMGLPLITSYVGGIKEYSKSNVTGYNIKNPDDYIGFRNAILKMYNMQDREKLSNNVIEISKRYSIDKVNCIIKDIYYNFI